MLEWLQHKYIDDIFGGIRMKKILKKLGSGLSKLRNTKAKIIITAILTVIMLVDVNPFFLKAGR